MTDWNDFDWQAVEQARKTGQGISAYVYPWRDFDSRCVAGVKGGMSGNVHEMQGRFFAVSPLNGGPERQNLAAFRRRLEEARAKAENPEYIHKFISWAEVYRMESYIRQLEGDPDAIPEQAGTDYRAWVQYLRDNAPNE
jgi:hypothetical protein